MSEAQSGKLNIHLENRYYWPFQSRAGYNIRGVNESYYSTYERSLHSYTTAVSYTHLTQLQKADSHGTSKEVDVYVGGTVYLIDKVHPDKDATNTIQATTYKLSLIHI